MTVCQHGESSDCLDCEIAYHRAILEEFEIMAVAQRRRISELVQRQVKQIPVIGRVEGKGEVIYWPGLGEH